MLATVVTEVWKRHSYGVVELEGQAKRRQDVEREGNGM
jgi:hypothetical protein